MKHGSLSGYTNGKCRCDECRAVMSAYQRRYSGSDVEIDKELIGDLLAELFPEGLTDDCPARRAKARAS